MQRRAADLSGAELSGGVAVFAAESGDTSIPAGATVTQSGIIRGSVTLGAGATLRVASQTSLSAFGTISGPGAPAAAGTVAVADGATLFAAGPVTSGVVVRFSANGTLELAAQALGGFAGTIAGLNAGNALDIASAKITAVSLAPSAGGGTGLTLLNDGVAVATLQLGEASGPGLLAAVPDDVDGTLILAGPAMATPSTTAAPGTQSGASFQWQGSGGGQWSDAAHWNAGSAPGAADTVRIAGPSGALLPVAGAAAAASLTTSGDVALAGSFAVGRLTIAGNRLDALDLLPGAVITADMATLSGGLWQVAGSGAAATVAGVTTLSSGMLNVADGGTLHSASLVLAGATIMVDTAGTVVVGAGSGTPGTLAIGGAGTVSGFGTVRDAIADDGVLVVQGGTLSSFGAIEGAGQVLIGNGATLFAAAGIAGSVRVSFQPASGLPGASGSGTLELFASAAGFAATLAGVQPGDVLDFASGTVTQAAWTPPGPIDGGIGVLDLGTAGSVRIAVAPGVDPAAVSFAIAADGTGGSSVAMVPCFVAGTRLMAPSGEVLVEAIRAGDQVLTGGGAWRRVRWVGRAHHSAEALRTDPQLRPVRIAAGALGPAAGVPLPRRPLHLSPQHAVLMPTRHGEILVPAVALVDGAAVTRCPPGEGVTYVHIELDSHDVVVTEGALTETYLAGSADSRLLFAASPHPASRAVSEPCRKRVEHGPVILGLRRRLGMRMSRRAAAAITLRGNLERAVMTGGTLRVEGWALDEAARDTPVQIEILHEGVACGQATANLWRPDLDRAGLAGGSCGFVAELPWRAADVRGRLSVRPAARQLV